MDNLIYDDNTETTIGFYKDLEKNYKKWTQEAIERGDYDEAEDLISQMKEIEEHKEYDGLLRLSMNNGMGFTCRRLKYIEE